mmetsp:Transcript_66951/g.173574  ORF Transcript_66951/g.173574 Transcript_66951/m.173574 type:complete len:333 (+) Transcript_66951:1144-2142(+)
MRVLLLRRVRNRLQEAFRHARDDLLAGLAAPAGGDAGLHADDGIEELLGLVELRRDQRIRVQPEDSGILVHWQRLQVVPGLVQGALGWRVVRLQACEPEARHQHRRREVALQHRGDQPHVLVVCDAAAIVHLGDDVLQRCPGDLGLSDEVHAHLLAGHLEVGVHPLVGDVPTDGAELAALQDHRVEEGEAKEQFFVLSGLLRAGLVDVLADVLEGTAEVGAQALRRLVRDLDAVLEDWHGEQGRGHAREPEAVLLVDLLRILRLLDLLKLAHPAGRQVAILQAHPVACVPAQLDEGLCLGALALAQGDEVQALAVPLLGGQLQQVLRGVRAR